MAAYKSTQSTKKKEHAFQTIGKDLKAGKIPSLVFLCGEEQYLVHWAVSLLKGTYINKACESLDFTRLEPEELTVSRIKESCETLSMFSSRRMVLIPEFPPALGQKLKGFSESDEKELLEYIEDLPETCMLIITAAKPDPQNKKKSKLQAAAEKAGAVYDFGPLSGAQLRSFIAKRFKASSKTYRDSVVNLLIEDSGYGNKEIDYNLYNLENDIKKVIAHSTGNEIVASDVAETVSSNLETNVFAMLDAISRNRKDEAYRLLHNLLVSGEAVYGLLALITSQLELILEVKEMREEGMNPAQMHKLLGVHEFRIKKAMGVTEKYSVAGLKKILSKAYEIDGTIKSGLLEQNLALELFIAEI
ncbi:MAG: DNA polymerase III subunit delta [Firmicutes bacterium]|nr:DNA polymerase III subunit delta [Bacillota bacterium]